MCPILCIYAITNIAAVPSPSHPFPPCPQSSRVEVKASPLARQRAEDKERLSQLNRKLERYISTIRNQIGEQEDAKKWRAELESENAKVREQYEQASFLVFI